jgi:hypothetical protein
VSDNEKKKKFLVGMVMDCNKSASTMITMILSFPISYCLVCFLCTTPALAHSLIVQVISRPYCLLTVLPLLW